MIVEYGPFAEAIEKNNKFDVDHCDLCDSNLRIKKANLHVIFKGKKMADFYRIPQYNIISQKFQEILIKNSITGFSFDDIHIEDEDSTLLPKNHINSLKELVVLGEGGFLHHLDGTIVRKCENCGRILENQELIKGFSVNFRQWDGSDIFYFKNWFGMPIVTAKVKEIIEEENLKNINFTDLNQFKFS
ncbi:hypothetical protein [Neobacillus endophyticus]|uniref:hypothetical protein n=1 Tax=Neobacillus endophyticus TaxID=2738405 RepID=UPI001C25CF6D|nr:hypothetical protein [Neobacillus endophyticus]